jgi:hypothetical protein
MPPGETEIGGYLEASSILEPDLMSALGIFYEKVVIKIG